MRHGEILGIAGLVGAGRTEMARAIFGADPFDSGRVCVDGEPVAIRSPREAIRHGIGLVPEDRKQQALFLALAVRMNCQHRVARAAAPLALFRRRGGGTALVEEYPPGAQHPHGEPGAAGGQPVGRQPAEGRARPLAGAPAEGADRRRADARHRRRRQGRGAQSALRDGAKPGIAVIAISSELPEILAISDRIVTMREGRVTGEIARDEATRGDPDGDDDARAREGSLTEETGRWPRSSAADAAPAAKIDLFGFLARFAPLIFLIVLMAAFAIAEPRFLSSVNLFNVMRQVSIFGLLAIGMTFVILTAGIDLSVGSLLAFAGLVAAAVVEGRPANRFTVGEGQDALGYGWYLAALAAIAVGLVGGFLQGFAITRLKVPPFVVTLGGMSAFRGAALLFAAGGPISGFEPDFVWWGQGTHRSARCRCR